MKSERDKPTLKAVRAAMDEVAEPQRVAELSRFFKSGPGEYAEGDRFIGIRVPALRQLARSFQGLSHERCLSLLRSPIHEERLLALLIWVGRFPRADDKEQRRINEAYLANTTHINNWDLVDVSAEHIVGTWLRGRSKRPLEKLARSESLWERRIAIIATFTYIKDGELEATERIAELLLDDEHDLIHKAVGWMLRELGKRDGGRERDFLRRHYPRLARTTLRYAIEKFPEAERRRWLAGPVS